MTHEHEEYEDQDDNPLQGYFDWQVTTPLSDGVRRAIDYYREFGLEETYTHLRIGNE